MKLHTCGAGPCPHEAGGLAARLEALRPPSGRTRTVDVHCHALVPEVEELVAARSEPRAEADALRLAMGEDSFRHNQARMLPEAGPRLVSVEQRLADMDAMGVDVQVLSPSPTQFHYWAEPDLADRLVRRLNEGIASLCARNPRRLLGLGSVALQHGEAAADHFEHAVRDCGLRGVEISSTVGGRELDDASLAPFWAKAEELGCVVFIHPFGTTLGTRLDRYYLQNVIGQPLETTIALSRLIFGGVLDRHPGLRILAAHGGGYLPYYLGRSSHAWHVRPEAAGAQFAPLEYLRRLWFDTLVYDPVALRRLVELVGAARVVTGTDYPFDMGSYRIHELVADAVGAGTADAAAMLGGNAAELFQMAFERVGS